MMAVAPRSGDAVRVLAAPAGPLMVHPVASSAGAPLLSLVVPTLNESENIADFLGAVRTNLDDAIAGNYEVIVVDDDSADRTWEIAAALMPEFPELRVMRRQREGGL